MASAVDSRLAYARLSAVATASRLPTATRGSNNSYTTSWDTTPARQHLVVERRGMARDHHLAGQILEQVQERDMVDLLVVEAIAPCRTAGRVQIGGSL